MGYMTAQPHVALAFLTSKILGQIKSELRGGANAAFSDIKTQQA